MVKTIETFKFDVIVFDTAPTGHTLKLLNFPNILEKGLEKIMSIKNKIGGLLSGFMSNNGN
jgi:arsenite-transporting ATPase